MCHMLISQLDQARWADIFKPWLNKFNYANWIINLCAPSPCVQYQDGQKRRKPNYSSVDLSEVEWEDKDDVVSVKPIKLRWPWCPECKDKSQNIATNYKVKSLICWLVQFGFSFFIYCCVFLFVFYYLPFCFYMGHCDLHLRASVKNSIIVKLYSLMQINSLEYETLNIFGFTL